MLRVALLNISGALEQLRVSDSIFVFPVTHVTYLICCLVDVESGFSLSAGHWLFRIVWPLFSRNKLRGGIKMIMVELQQFNYNLSCTLFTPSSKCLLNIYCCFHLLYVLAFKKQTKKEKERE